MPLAFGLVVLHQFLRVEPDQVVETVAEATATVRRGDVQQLGLGQLLEELLDLGDVDVEQGRPYRRVDVHVAQQGEAADESLGRFVEQLVRQREPVPDVQAAVAQLVQAAFGEPGGEATDVPVRSGPEARGGGPDGQRQAGAQMHDPPRRVRLGPYPVDPDEVREERGGVVVVAARCLEYGVLDRTVRRVREVLAPRHDNAVAAVRAVLGSDALMAVPGGGYFIGVLMETDLGEEEFRARAARAGVALTAGSAFYPDVSSRPAGRIFLRLPFQAMPPEEFTAGVTVLGAVGSGRRG